MRVALRLRVLLVLLSCGLTAGGFAQTDRSPLQAVTSTRVSVSQGLVDGVAQPGGIRSFKGIPFAAPPVGALRWKAPQPPTPWTGVRTATEFGARCLQGSGARLTFRSSSASEDCLYLNVWTPATSADDRLPVLVYFHGGGFQSEDGSEPRHDGATLARRGIVTVTVNYRLGLYGFLVHPWLSAESAHGGSGNYGLLDQSAALRWVQQNISAFGGDPRRVTIAGNSSGAASVSALMVSPRSRDLIAAAIGSAGAMITPAWTGSAGAVNPARTPPWTAPADAEEQAVRFTNAAGVNSLSELRALSAMDLQKLTTSGPPFYQFFPVLDGDFLTKLPAEYFARGEQAKVPLLVGWTSSETDQSPILQQDPPTAANFAAALQRLYRERGDEVLKLYSATTPDEVSEAARSLASDRWLVYPTWKWAELHGRTSGHPVYRYFFVHRVPWCGPNATTSTRRPQHVDDMDYAMGNGNWNACDRWTSEDEAVSQFAQDVYVNFVKTGNPNGVGLPQWSATNIGAGAPILFLGIKPRVEDDPYRQRYLFHDSIYSPR